MRPTQTRSKSCAAATSTRSKRRPQQRATPTSPTTRSQRSVDREAATIRRVNRWLQANRDVSPCSDGRYWWSASLKIILGDVCVDRYARRIGGRRRAKSDSHTGRRKRRLVLEDLHWADATTRDFFDFTRNALCSLPVMLVATLRPDLKSPWIDEPGVSVLALGHLPRDEARALAGWVGGAGRQTPGLLDWIVDHSDGLPLFIEELTKGVVEDALGLTEQEQKLAVPTTLQASLMARIDRSPSARWVAQTGSVIGREFRYDLLARVACTSQKVLTEGLEQLVASGLLFRRGSSPNTSYFSFKHSLVQHAA
jgi:hypothetical protein